MENEKIKTFEVLELHPMLSVQIWKYESGKQKVEFEDGCGQIIGMPLDTFLVASEWLKSK